MISKALAFSGSIGSGKSTLSFEVSKFLGWKYTSFGDYVRKEASKLGYDPTSREHLQSVGAILVADGIENFCLAVLQEVEWKRGDGIVIDGIRHLEIFLKLQEILNSQKLYLIYVTLDKEARARRVVSRARDLHSSINEEHSTEIQVAEILRVNADFSVDTKATVNDNVQSICQWLDSNCVQK